MRVHARYESHILDFDHFPFFNPLLVVSGHVILIAV